MQYNKNFKQRNSSIQGLRSFRDTLPKKIKKIIDKKGHIYSETLNNWKYIVGDELFKYCYPKSFKNSNRFGVSTLVIMVKRGHEVDLEYSKQEIMDKMNNFFGYSVVEKLKFTSFNDETEISNVETQTINVTNNKFKERFELIEIELARNGKHPREASLDEMNGLWEKAKESIE